MVADVPAATCAQDEDEGGGGGGDAIKCMDMRQVERSRVVDVRGLVMKCGLPGVVVFALCCCCAVFACERVAVVIAVFY